MQYGCPRTMTSWRMMAKLKTSPLGCWFRSNSSSRNNSGAVHNNSEMRTTYGKEKANKACCPTAMGFLPDTWKCGLRMRRGCRERIPRHRLQSQPLVSDPGMHHGTCVTHVPWCMSGSLARGGGENVPGIPGACANRNFTYLTWGPSLRAMSWYPLFLIKSL